MKIKGQDYHTIWRKADANTVCVIDQRWLPHRFEVLELTNPEDAAFAISDMAVRGAPLIGVTAAFGMALACLHAPKEGFEAYLTQTKEQLQNTRPTAVNLQWALTKMEAIILASEPSSRVEQAFAAAEDIKSADIQTCHQIGMHGLQLIEAIHAQNPNRPINILTHCNAGWLACVDWGTATSPIYQAHNKGIPVHVWVDETRPRNQGAHLTAFELGEHGVPYSLITDNTGGHLMQHGMVDIVIVGTDRTTRNGDVANKIGTYLKALAAFDNYIPFYIGAPSSSIDWSLGDGLKEIPIEQRHEEEVLKIQGKWQDEVVKVDIAPSGAKAVNYGFDVTPARLVTGLITERGVCDASEAGLKSLFPENYD